LGLEHKNEDAARQALEDHLKDAGIGGLIDKADEELLKNFCETLGLESTDRVDMIKQIADEVMLTGMESFLNKLNLPVLKSHCMEMELLASGTKIQLVERLMVHIFELEPLEDEKKKEKSTSPDKKKDKSKVGKGKEKSGNKKKDKKETPEKEKTAEKKAIKKDKGEPSPKRTKFVAPPLDTIRKGKFDTYVDLYDNFNLPDLQDYCKKEGLKVSGKKPVLIKRILNYLVTGKKEEPGTVGKKRKAEESPKKKETTKKQKKETVENGKQK